MKPKNLKRELLKHVLEDQVQRDVVRWLELHKFNPTVNPSRAPYSSKGQKFKRFDGTKGSPDIIVVVNSFYIGLELKRPVGGVQSDDQRGFQANLEQIGGGYYQLVTSLDDIEWLLRFREKSKEFFGYVNKAREETLVEKDI